MNHWQAAQGKSFDAGQYEIRIKGHLAERWHGWFDGLRLTCESDGTTLVEVGVVDQAALHGLLQKVRDTGLPLISVTRIEPPPGSEPPGTDPHQPPPEGAVA